MILHWFLSVFPRDMLQGWRLVRPDLVLWVALSALLGVAALALPANTDGSAPILPAFIGLATSLITATLPPVLFTAAVTGRQVSWRQVWIYLLRRAPTMLAFWVLALIVAIVPAFAVGGIVGILFGATTAAVPLSALAAILVFLTFAVRFSFLPFLAILYERSQIPEALWQFPRAPWLGSAAWPLFVGTKLSETVRWKLAPYVVLVGVVGIVPNWLHEQGVEAIALLPVQVVCQVLVLSVQAVLFSYFSAQTQGHGIPAATLIEIEVEA